MRRSDATQEDRTRDQARQVFTRAARAVERAGLKTEWVRRLARRMAKLGDARVYSGSKVWRSLAPVGVLRYRKRATPS